MVTIAAFFYLSVLLFKYITGDFMVFVDREQDEEGGRIPMVKCVIYSRVSTEEQSTANQINVLTEWAETRGFTVVEVYQEQEVPGVMVTSGSLPGFHEMPTELGLALFWYGRLTAYPEKAPWPSCSLLTSSARRE